ncbi:3'-5' exonuclease [Immundisolibacter sp.]|uniref:3'-5' exonuclease n=1 Tax=Immundisolibacter sp. TaxID=1934948 RepID=UPI002635A3EC|nr:3'-5' exonuclease [Immundisolibacter sp.]MDD3652302.1 3'-5' exonuclease [Immundisolibacter sp.]
MFKSVFDKVWAFDCEWVPDPAAGRVLYKLPADLPDRDVLAHMWQQAGASDDDPMPFLKTVVCRVVSIAAVTRQRRRDGSVQLHLLSLPRDPHDPTQTTESQVIGTFLDAIGEHKPQLVGFNSINADLKILLQRALINGLSAAEFCRRPDKPWEGIDYFARGDAHVDIKDIVGGWGKATPSLHELAVLSGIPGKLDVDGNAVAELWLGGELDRIVAYNECDALTTYLVWLRLAHLGGHFDDAAYAQEQRRVRELIEREVAGARPHLQTFLAAWQRLGGDQPSAASA